VLDPRLSLLVSRAAWNDIMNVVDDPRIGLIMLIGSILLCAVLFFGRRPRMALRYEQRGATQKAFALATEGPQLP
jgi:hypothetical protein